SASSTCAGWAATRRLTSGKSSTRSTTPSLTKRALMPDPQPLEAQSIDLREPLASDLPPLRAALEAILMLVEEPAGEGWLAPALNRPREEVSATLRELSAEYDAAGRGFELRGIAGGWRFYSRTDCAPYVERFIRDGQPAKLSQAALETLAVVAYRQPT